MESQVPLCRAGCQLIFLKGFGYSETGFAESLDDLVKEINESNIQGEEVRVKVMDDVKVARQLILRKEICDDGITCVVICFEEGVEHIQKSLCSLQEEDVHGIRKNVAIFAIHSGSYYQGITEDLAKIAINIDLAKDGSEEGAIETGIREGKTTKKIHFPSEGNPYALKNCVPPSVKHFILSCLSLSGDHRGYCKTHGGMSTPTKEKAPDAEQPEASSSLGPAEIEAGAAPPKTGQKRRTISLDRKGHRTKRRRTQRKASDAEQPEASSSLGPVEIEAGAAPPKTAQKRTELQEKKVIGPSGGELNVGGCGVTFPQGAVTKETEFKILVEHRVHPSTADNIQVTPVLQCLPSIEFQVPVKVKLQARSHAGSNNVMAHVMMQENNEAPSPLLNVPLKCDDGVIEFECRHFTWFWAYIKRLLFGETEFIIHPTLYLSRQEGNFCLVLKTDNSPDRLNNPGFVVASAMFGEFVLKAREEILISLRCEDPEDFRILPRGNQIFIPDENFGRVGVEHIAYRFERVPPAGEMLTMHCRIGVKEMRFKQRFPELTTSERTSIGVLVTGDVGNLRV